MSIRLVWLASKTETGLPLLKQQWSDATVGLVSTSRMPVHVREPVDQATFWLAEVDRVLKRDPANAELAVGAALALDSAALGFVSNYMKQIRSSAATGVFPEIDRAGIENAIDIFEDRCNERCLELAARATQLDSSCAQWWQLRAMLLWRHSMFSDSDSPRDGTWGEILKECSRQDPDNALYDYLAAQFFWESSSELELATGDVRLVINDAVRFEHGIRCFEAGLAKPAFNFGDAGFPAAARFLEQSSVPPLEQEQIVNSRNILTRRSLLLSNIWRWQHCRTAESRKNGDFETAVALAGQNLRLISQFTGGSPSTSYDNTAVSRQLTTAIGISEIANDGRDSFSPEELKEILSMEAIARIDQAVFREVFAELADGQQSRNGRARSTSSAPTVSEIAAAELPSFLVVLFLVGIVAAMLSRFSNRDLSLVRPFEHVTILLLAFAISIAFFGLAPAKIISPQVQAWVSTAVIIFVPVVFVAYVVWRWFGERRLKFSLRFMLITMFGLCVLMGIVSALRPIPSPLLQLPFDFSMSARGPKSFDARSLDVVAQLYGVPAWVLVQWIGYSGHFVMLAVWAAVAASLLVFKLRKERNKPNFIPMTYCDNIRAFGLLLGKPFVALSWLLLVVYLCLAPGFLNSIEQKFQDKMEFARHPDDHWARVQSANQKIQSNETTMQELRKAVSYEMTTGESVE